ncbi:Proteasome activator pa28, C-terminal domain,Proteasome activator pa28 [Cinara cedri]|uniref:Proteasome activator pa28, C-terminal domain,Proteasome activator pa28 n=1 Tax=Cinara cedri TaxID=506608 RepID=A0A5E4M7L2_9HEMI|nr:Proteasome activator pa28, C-terminal domain,Proteasome activator pa28 [Cinara cedri]
MVHLNEILEMPQFDISKMKLNCAFNELTLEEKDDDQLDEDQLGDDQINNDQLDIETEVNKKKDSELNDAILKLPFVPCNQRLNEIFEIMKPSVRQLHEDTNALYLWVTLLVPKMEDGNNIGIGVQEDILKAINAVHKKTVRNLKRFHDYYEHRTIVMNKFLNHPNIEDYRQAVENCDNRQCFMFSIAMQEIRDSYALLMDIMIKNMDKIKNPQQSSAPNMY